MTDRRHDDNLRYPPGVVYNEFGRSLELGLLRPIRLSWSVEGHGW
jgi:hypothetical protein